MRSSLIVLILLAFIPLNIRDAAAEVRVFVTNEKSNDVTVIDHEAGTVLKTIAVGQRPRGVAASPDGQSVYVANSNSNTLMVLDARALTVLDSVPAGEDPEGLTVTPDGRRIFAVNENGLTVTVLDAVSRKSSPRCPPAPSPRPPWPRPTAGGSRSPTRPRTTCT